jgi:CheY-like chemotaxis protein
MRKRVLVVEQSDAIRGVAETVLRQNGFEVISISSADKALEVLKLTRPDLMIMGGELTTADQRPLYDRIQGNPKTASIAMLLFTDADDDSLPFPPEVLVPRPINPKEFLEKVMIFSGQSKPDGKQAAPNPLGEASLDDEFLDSALGLDNIDVVDSEVMDKTGAVKTSPVKAQDKSTGLGSVAKDSPKDSGRVESVMIRASADADKQPAPQPKKQPLNPSASGKLEIAADQYGLVDPDALQTDIEGRAHDYNWFINEMRKDVETSPAIPAPSSGTPAHKTPASELAISEPASLVDPVTPPPDVRKDATARPKSAGVEKFIDEFKKEIEKVRDDEPESVVVEADKAVAMKPGAARQQWEESIENITREQVDLFTRELCSELSERIAKLIVSKIDSDKLRNMIVDEILARARNKT